MDSSTSAGCSHGCGRCSRAGLIDIIGADRFYWSADWATARACASTGPAPAAAADSGATVAVAIDGDEDEADLDEMPFGVVPT